MALLNATSSKLSAARPSRRTAVVVRAAEEVKVGINGAWVAQLWPGVVCCVLKQQSSVSGDLWFAWVQDACIRL